MKKDTLLARAGRDPARYQGMVNTPVFRTSTVIFPDHETYEARGGDDYKKVRYGLTGTPTTFALEEAVAHFLVIFAAARFVRLAVGEDHGGGAEYRRIDHALVAGGIAAGAGEEGVFFHE